MPNKHHCNRDLDLHEDAFVGSGFTAEFDPGSDYKKYLFIDIKDENQDLVPHT
jgi:hypothetical protein